MPVHSVINLVLLGGLKLFSLSLSLSFSLSHSLLSLFSLSGLIYLVMPNAV